MLDAAKGLDLVGSELTPEAAQTIVEEDLAPAFPGELTNCRGARATTEMNRRSSSGTNFWSLRLEKTLRQPARGHEVTVVSHDQLTRDMQPFTRQLIDGIGITHAEADWPINADDLLFYLSDASAPMVAFMRERGLFIDGDGLHFDLARFGAVKDLAEKVIAAHNAGDFDGVWRELDLSGDEDVDYDGGYILTALTALELLYAPPK